MAKHQDLALNIQKLSGVCGRLMCCLSYEDKYYVSEMRKFPKVGSTLEIAGSRAHVVSVNCISREIVLRLPDGIQKTIKLEELPK